MNYDKWKKRIAYRSDLSMTCTHLTRGTLNSKGEVEHRALDVLIKILNDRKLIGSSTSSGFIVGPNRAVCFQEAPLYGIGQNVYHEQEFKEELGGKVRYTGLGLCFPKQYLYSMGARPVIYEKTEIAKAFLEKEEWYRIVNFDISNPEKVIDWTHEREWRVKGDFEFSLSQAIIILPNDRVYQAFIEKVDGDLLKKIRGIVTLNLLVF